jgi:hypothetical protein
VDDLGEDILGIGQLDDGGLLGGPEGFPAATDAILVFGEELVGMAEELGEASAIVHDDGVIVVGCGGPMFGAIVLKEAPAG